MKKLFAFLKNRGFTLVEALVATIIAGYCILPIMGTLHMGVQKTQGFDHYEKLRLLARSRLNKELSVGAFDHTAIDTTTTFHYVYYNTDAEPQLLTIDTNIASGSTASAGTFLNIATVSSILYSYKVSVAIKENLQLGTSTQNIQSDYLKSISGLKALTVKAELEYNDNVGAELEIDPSDPASPPLPSISLFSLLNLPSFSDDYIWISNPKNVEIIAIDPISRTKVDSFLLRLDDTTKPRDDGANDGARPWNIAVHPNQKFIAIQCKHKIKALNIDPESQWYGLAKEIWPMNTVYNKDGSTTNIGTIDPAYSFKLADVNKDDKNKAAEDRSIVFRPDGKMCYVAAHEEKMVFAFVASNTENWTNLALTNKTTFTTTTDKSSFLHAGNDGYLYSGPTDIDPKVVFRFPMYSPNPLANPEKIDDPDSNEKVEGIATTPDGKEFYILWDKSIITRHDSRTGAKIGGTTITPTDASKHLKDITLSADGRYLAMMDPTDAAGKGGMFVLNLSTNPITSVNYNFNTQVPAILKRATPDAIKKTGVNYVLFAPQSQDFVFDDITKPNIFAVDIPGLTSDSYTSSLPADRVINFATSDKSEVAMNLRFPQFVLVGTADKSIQFLDVNTGKTVETKKIDLEAVPVDAAISPQGEKLKVVFGSARAGVDTYDIPTRIRTQNAHGAQQMYEVAIPNTYFHTSASETYFSTLDKHSTLSWANGYWANVPLPGTPPADYRMPNNVDFSCDWVPQNMVPLTNGGFLYLFKKADGSTCLEWVGNRPWGPLVNNYERFARWYSIYSAPQTTLNRPATMPSTSGSIDNGVGTITLLKNATFPDGYKITRVKFNSTAACSGRSITPVIVEVSGSTFTIRDIGNPITVSSTAHDEAVTWERGGKISANYLVGWWNGINSTANAGVVKWNTNASGLFVSDYGSIAAIGSTIADTYSGSVRDYEIQFQGDPPPPEPRFPPLNAVNIAVSPDDRYLAIETIGAPNQIHLYDFAANNFYQETQLNGLVIDYRSNGADVISSVANTCSLSVANPSLASGIKLANSITSRDIWGSHKDWPGNYYYNSGSISTQMEARRDASKRFFGYFVPTSNFSTLAVAHRDPHRLWFGSSQWSNIGLLSSSDNVSTNTKDSFGYSPKLFFPTQIQLNHMTNGGERLIGLFTMTSAADVAPTQTTGASYDLNRNELSGWDKIASTSTRPFEFKPTWLRTYNLTGCDNDPISAMVWSRDMGNPILFHLDTVQDDFWAIKPGVTAPTRFDMGGTYNTLDRQLVISDDGQKLIFAKEDTNEVVFIDIANPASFSFNGATRTVSTLTGFGSIARIATMTATPKVLATLPFNRYKSTPHSGSYQQVATLSVNISGLQNAALASGGIYILGGAPTINGAFGGSVTVDGTPTDKIFKFDPTYTYAPGFAITPLVATLTRAVKRHAVVAYDNEVYVFNGRYDATNNTSWVQKFNPTTGMVSSSIDPVTTTLEDIIVSRTMTSGSAPTPTIVTHTGSVYTSPGIPPANCEGWRAFDGTHNSYPYQWSPTTAGQTVKYNAGNAEQAFMVNKIKVSNYDVSASSDAMKTFDFLGDSTPLLTGKTMTTYNSTQEFAIPSPGIYQTYSLKALTKWDGGTSAGFTVSEIQFILAGLRRISPLGTPTAKDHTNRIYTYSNGTIVKASHQEATSDTEAAWRAFDGTAAGNPNQWDTNSGSFATNPPWLSVDLGAGKEDLVDVIRFIYEINDQGLKTFKFQGSNVANPGTASDSADWVTLNLGGSNVPTTTNARAWFHYHVTNPGKYRHYRIVCLSSWGTDIELWEMEMFSTVSPPPPAGTKLTKTLFDNRSENAVADSAACVTPYGIMIAGGGSSNCLIYWPHGIDDYTDNSDYSLGISKSLPPLPANRSYHNLIWHKGRVFRVGGSDGTALNSIDVFSFDTNAWTNVPLTTVASFPVNGAQLKRDNAAACSLGDEIFMFGGYDGAALKNDAIAWNPETGNIRLLGAMPMAGNYAKSAVACGSSIYLIGGATNATSGGTAGIWKFTP